MTVIAFVYAGFQACELAYQLIKGKHIINHHLRFHFDFFMDQASWFSPRRYHTLQCSLNYCN